MKKRTLRKRLVLVATALLLSACTTAHQPLTIEQQGSFAVGGTVITAPGTFDPIKQGAYNPAGPDSAGQTLHGDHAYVFYQVPANARRLPLVLLARTWAIGKDMGDHARRTRGIPDDLSSTSLSCVRHRSASARTRGAKHAITEFSAVPDEQLWFGIFRLGVWPDFYPNVAFSREPEALNQFFRQMVPNAGPYDVQVNVDAVSALFTKIGPGILVTHSQSGALGWRTAAKSPNVRAIVSYEPGGDFIFPEGEAPRGAVRRTNVHAAHRAAVGLHAAHENPDRHLLRRQHPGAAEHESGAGAVARVPAVARLWRDAVNRHGGDVTVVHLPEIGIRGNTHFPMSDLNNVEIANHLSEFLRQKGLD